MDKATAVGIIIVVLSIVLIVNTAWTHWTVGMAFQREVSVYFEYADRASTADLKSKDFDKFINALEEEKLTDGCSSVWFCDQPNSQLGKNYEVAKSLQTRLHELKAMDHNSMQYQQGMQQITLQEFCWFPIGSFHDAYMKNNGAWGDALVTSGVTNRCAPPPQ